MFRRKKDRILIDELSLMVDVFNSCIETGIWPQRNSPCQNKCIELMKRAERTPSSSQREY